MYRDDCLRESDDKQDNVSQVKGGATEQKQGGKEAAELLMLQLAWFPDVAILSVKKVQQNKLPFKLVHFFVLIHKCRHLTGLLLARSKHHMKDEDKRC